MLKSIRILSFAKISVSFRKISVSFDKISVSFPKISPSLVTFYLSTEFSNFYWVLCLLQLRLPHISDQIHYLLFIRNNVKSKLVLFLIFSQILTSAVHYLCLIFLPKKGTLFLKKYGKRWYVLITLNKNTKLYLILIYRRTVFIPFHFFTNF